MTPASRVIKYTDVNPAKLTISELKEGKFNKNQLIAYMRLNKEELKIQTPMFKLINYGIPRTSIYYKDDESRAFIRVASGIANPYNPSNPKLYCFDN